MHYFKEEEIVASTDVARNWLKAKTPSIVSKLVVAEEFRFIATNFGSQFQI